jgi:hypothetical protein
MIQLDERLREYAAARAERISQNDSDLLVARALARPARRGQLTRHGRNVAGAVLAILLLVGP